MGQQRRAQDEQQRDADGAAQVAMAACCRPSLSDLVAIGWAQRSAGRGHRARVALCYTTTVWYLIDLASLGLIALLVWLSLRRGPLRAVAGIARLLAASLAGWAACQLVRWCGGQGSIGVALWAIGIGGAVGLAALVALALWERRWTEPWSRWESAHRRRARLIAAGVALTWTLSYLLCWIILANAVAASSAPSATAMRERSLVTRWLLSRRLADSGPAAQPAGASEPAPSAIDALLSASGASRMLTMLADMRAITAMGPEERERLIASSPPLRALVADPALLTVLDDVHCLRLVDQACHGSFSAINQLADDPAIAALGHDAALRAAIAALDPDTLAQAIRACREAPGARVAWSVASAPSTLQAASVLTASAAWSTAASDQLAWPRGARCGLARARLRVPEGGATLTVASPDTVACWLDGHEVALTRLPPPPGPPSDPERELPLGAPGDHAIILMVTPGLWSALAGPQQADSLALRCRAVVRAAAGAIATDSTTSASTRN